MKAFKNSSEYYKSTIYPDLDMHPENLNAFNTYDQKDFSAYLKKLGADETGDLTYNEEQTIEKIKMEIKQLISENKDIRRDRLEFDLAIIFHKNLKKINFGRALLNDYNMWRWLSLSYFLKEVRWRRGEEKMKKGQVIEAAKATYDHLVGSRVRDIFPRRYFILGERLYDKEKGYDIIRKLSQNSKENNTGGFGNLILNLIDTKLISPNDYVSKTMSELLFFKEKLAEDKEVTRAFVRYNGFSRRLLNSAGKEIFQNEICVG